MKNSTWERRLLAPSTIRVWPALIMLWVLCVSPVWASPSAHHLVPTHVNTAVGNGGGSNDWWTFEHDLQHTGRSPFTGPSQPGVQWKFTGTGYVFASPVIGADGTVYVGSADGYLYAVNPDGTRKWSFNAGDEILNSAIVAPDGTIYFNTDTTLFSVSSTGMKNWSLVFQDPYPLSWSTYSTAPILGPDGTIYFGSNFEKATEQGIYGMLYAVDSATGLEKWAFSAGTRVMDCPTLSADGSTVYFGSLDGNLYALATASGTTKWAFPAGAIIYSSPMIDANGIIYVGSSNGNLYAVTDNGATAAEKWAFNPHTGKSIDATPVLGADGTVYYPGEDGYLYAINPATGTQNWAYYFQEGGTSQSPAIDANGTLYFGTYLGVFFAINANGTLQWSYNVGSEVPVPYSASTSPAIAANGTVYASQEQLFAIVQDFPTQLAFGTQPANNISAGATFSPAVTVLLEDPLGNVVTTANGPVTLSLGALSYGQVGGPLNGTLTVTAVNGVATFSNLSINVAAFGYTLIASAPGLPNVTSRAISINAGPAARLAFQTQPSNATAGTAISTAVTVLVQDALGNTLTSTATSITLAIGANPGGATLGGTITAAAFSGVATFSTLTLNRPATGYTLTASATGLTPASSASFNITIGAPAKLVFISQPSNTAVGATITPALAIAAEDTAGILVTTENWTVYLSINTNPGGATLGGTTQAAEVNGVATFNNISLNKIGTGYTLYAAAADIGGAALSQSFNITAGPPAKLVMQTQPTNTVAGSTITPAVKVAVEDAAGNLVTTVTTAVSLALAANPGASTLAGTLTKSTVGGVASFNDLSLNHIAFGYTLSATATGLIGATTTSFNITAGPPTQLVFLTQPSNSGAGQRITPSVTVAIEDASGNVTTASMPITLGLAVNPSGATLYGAGTLSAVNGVATFSSLRLAQLGNGYTLVASATGLTGATSNPFNITVGAPAQLVFQSQPTTTVAGATMTPAVTVLVQDGYGNTVTTATDTISLVMGVGWAPLGGTLSQAALNGVATFNDLSIDQAGSGYTLLATAPGLAGVYSSPFAITAGSPSMLVFQSQPANTSVGVDLTPLVTVAVADSYGNPVSTVATTAVTLTLNTDPGGATLAGTLTQQTVAGVATFNDLTIDQLANGFSLNASADGLTTASSWFFAITGTLAAPTFTPPAGSYTGTQMITISSSSNGATIFYTTDGSTPSEIGGVPQGTTQMGASVTLAANTTLQAIAYEANMTDSSVTSGVYAFNQVATPVFAPAAGGYIGTQKVAISTLTPGAKIRYTIDGSIPSDTHGILYGTMPVTISADTTLHAIAYKSGMVDSSISSGAYSIFCAQPTFSLAAGTYNVAKTVTIKSATIGATFFYTTDGSTPSEVGGVPQNTTLAGSSVIITGSTTLQAIAGKSGLEDSTTASAAYTLQCVAPKCSVATGTYPAAKTVTLSTTTAAATIFYTLDGSTPSETGGVPATASTLPYLPGAPLTISAGTVLQAIAALAGWNDSTVSSATYTFQCAAPKISVATGTYTVAKSVTLSTTTAGATIYYTTDGSTPSAANGTAYTVPISINTNTRLQAITCESGWTSSAVSSATYSLQCVAPKMSVPTGSYTVAKSVTLSSTTAGASFFYTTDGNTPSETAGAPTLGTSTLRYTAPIVIGATTTLKAIAALNGWNDSTVTTAVYTLQCVAPTCNPKAGAYTGTQLVTLSSTTLGASIYYTTDGSTPNAATGTLYTPGTPVTISDTTTLKAIASLSGWSASTLSSGLYTIQCVTPTFLVKAGSYTGAQSVTISSLTGGATIRYTTDGITTPSETTGTAVANGTTITISTTSTLQAIAYNNDMTDSKVASGVYTIKCLAPAFSLAAGTYTGTPLVTISSLTSGATIMYTTDGSTPSATHGTVYTPGTPVTISATTTLKAIAVLSGALSSTVSSAAYTIQCVAPVFTPVPGTYIGTQTVTISSLTGGVTMRYTIDGSTPSATHGTIYTTSIALSASKTLQAIAYKAGLTNSAVSIGVYIIR